MNGNSNHQVAVGMTTCPRKNPTIRESINSLYDNGWGCPLVYSDQEMRGDWWGFRKVVRLLLEAYPTASYLVVLQDDVVSCSFPLRLEELGVFDVDLLSLFTCADRKELEKWTRSIVEHRSRTRVMEMKIQDDKERANACNGGIAYSLSRRFAESLMEDCPAKWTPTPQRLGEFCHNRQFSYNISMENLFEHIGEESTLHPGIPGYKWDISKAEPYRS